MSQTKKKSLVLIILSMIALVMFGCKDAKTEVQDISFKLPNNQTEIVLLVDEFFDLGDSVQVLPTYATDKTFTMQSSNPEIVKVVGNQVKAVSKGDTTVKVISNSNGLEDAINVKVLNASEKLGVPQNLTYDPATKTFDFESVDNSASYTLEINGTEINLGNVTTYNLNSYSGTKFDSVVSVRVKANAPEYTKAYKTSNYSNYYKIYQPSQIANLKIKGGVLSFDKHENLTYDIFVNGVEHQLNTQQNSFDFRNLEASSAGSTFTIKVVAKVKDEFISNNFGVNKFVSVEQEIDMDVIDVPTLEINGTVVSWNYVKNVSKYAVYLNGAKQTETENNYFDLTELSNFNSITYNMGEQTIKVLPVFDVNAENVTNTVKVNQLKFSRIETPEVALMDIYTIWNVIENASHYLVTVKKGGTIISQTNTNANEMDVSTFQEGNYEVIVQAIANNGYISSFTNSLTFEKHGQVQGNINNYILSFNTVVGDRYKVEFVINDTTNYREEITATGTTHSIDLSAMEFKAGLHTINITHLGNGYSTIDGATQSNISFTQLEAVDIVVSNSRASVTRSAINTNAVITLETTSDKLAEPIITNADSITYNTTEDVTGVLQTGEYFVKAYVKGDGSSTFSYRDSSKNLIECDKTAFTVLSVPTVTVLDVAKNEINISSSDGTNFEVYNAANTILGNSTGKFAITLNAGESKQFKARAVGNGSTTLSSKCSGLITVERPTTPTLSFDRTTNKVSVQLPNNISSHTLTLNNMPTTYVDAFDTLEKGNNEFEINCTAVGYYNNVYYINPLSSKINVYKLSNVVDMSVNSNNQLVITGADIADFKLDFSFDGTEYLASSNLVAGLPYSISGKVITIDLLDSNFNAIIDSMANGEFGVKIQYFNASTTESGGVTTYYADSAWSDEKTLKLNEVSNEVKVYTNTDNKIVIEPKNATSQCYLDVTFNVGGTNYEFLGNDRNQLVKDAITLAYTYSNGKYFIDLFDNYVSKIAGITAGSNFEVSVKFKKAIAGSDIDADYSLSYPIKVLNKAVFERSEQQIKFTSIENGYDLTNYKLFVDEQYLIDFSVLNSIITTGVNAGGFNEFSVNVKDLADVIKLRVSGIDFTQVHSLQIVSLNTLTSVDNPTISSMGDKFFIQQANSFEIESTKENGTTYVQFATTVTDYAKAYVININGTEYNQYAINDGSIVKINVEDMISSGSVSANGYVKTTGNYTVDGKLVYVFNSAVSNTKLVTKLAAPILSVENNVVKYTIVSGADDYEIYKKTAGGDFVLINDDEIEQTGNTFTFKNFAVGDEITLKVKAITNDQSILNSDLSDEITITKQTSASVEVVNGVATIVLPAVYNDLIEDENVEVRLNVLLHNSNRYICNLSTDYSSSFANIKWDSVLNRYVVNSTLLFNNADSYIVGKNISVIIEVNGVKDEKYYLYSNNINSNVYGLFAPENITVTEDAGNSYNISWTNNSKNKLSADSSLIAVDGYVVKFTYGGKEYLSTDNKLVFKNGANLYPYGVINSTSIKMPYGYDIGGAEEVIFGIGGYEISVLAYANGYCNSPLSSVKSITKLAAPNLLVEENVVKSTTVSGAESYAFYKKVEGGNFELISNDEIEQTGNTFTFKNFVAGSKITLKVMAVSSNQSVLNSDLSEEITITKLASASVEVVNGVAAIVLPSTYNDLITDENIAVKLNVLLLNSNRYVCNLSTDYSSSVPNIMWNADLNCYVINSSLLFNYTENYMVGKNVSVTVEVDGVKDDIYYLYADNTNSNVYGLFAPNSPEVYKVDDNVHNITWTNSNKNKLNVDGSLVNVDGYFVRFIYNGKDYYSYDNALVYKDGGSLKPYGNISSTSIRFPYGYDVGGENEVIFGEGEYLIDVMAYADGYCSSPLSSKYIFTVIASPSPNVENGVLTWNSITGATGYQVIVRTMADAIVNKYTTTSTSYDLAPMGLVGRYKVSVKATSTRVDILNSAESEILNVYCLAKADDLFIDDGRLVIYLQSICSGVEVISAGQKYVMTNDGQLNYLNSNVSVIDDSSLITRMVAMLNVYMHGGTTDFRVRLLGNTGMINVNAIGEIAIINSDYVDSSVTAGGLNANVNTVTAGVWQFNAGEGFGTTSPITINYNFNNIASIHPFWATAIVYDIEITTYGQGEEFTNNLYVVNYNRFMAAVDKGDLTTNSSNQTYYELSAQFCDDCSDDKLCTHYNNLCARIVYKDGTDKLYFNVYKDNIIDLQTYNELYFYETIEHGINQYSCDGELKRLNLSLGGSFAIVIRTLGGDETAISAYLSSNAIELPIFVRFGDNQISTRDGEIVIDDISQSGAASPVYKITVYSFSGSQKWYAYLFNEEETTEAAVREKFNLTADDICVPQISKDGKLVFNMSHYFPYGVYNADVRTMAGVGADDYQLNAKLPDAADKVMLKVLSTPNPTIVDGVLEFGLSSVDINGTPEYSYAYEVTLKFASSEYVFNLNSATEGLLIENNKIIYMLPDSIEDAVLRAGTNYTIQIRSLTGKNGLINSQKSSILNFTRQTPVENVKIENGVLTWVGETTGKYIIKVAFGTKFILIDEGYTRDGTKYSYEFNDNDYEVFGASQTVVKIEPNVAYRVSVIKVGDSSSVVNSLNTFVSGSVNRLNISAVDLKAANGLLIWNAVPNVKEYLIRVNGSTNYVYTINAGSTVLDFNTVLSDAGTKLSAGNYNISIKAIGETSLNSMVFNSNIEFVKLNAVKDSSVSIVGNVISWEEVENAEGYFVQFEYNGEVKPYIYINDTKIDAPSGVQGTLTFRIYACGSTANNLFNSDVIEISTSSNTPSAVTNLNYNTLLNRFEWEVGADFVSTDVLKIHYNFTEYTADGKLAEVPSEDITITYQQSGFYENGKYYFPITTIGEYKGFTVIVQRANALSSDPTTATTQFVTLFSYGNGTQENPYAIKSEIELTNISYFKNAHYILINDITLSSIYTSSVLNFEFAGHLNGNNKLINMGNIMLSNVKDFAIFNSLNGANIYDLEIQANITNIITSNSAAAGVNGGLRIALLAVSSNNATINNVRILNSTITLREETANTYNEVSGNVYVAGLIAQDNASNLTSVLVDIEVAIGVDASGDFYYGSISAVGENTIADSSTIDVLINLSKETIKYFGGAFGYYEGKTSRDCGIKNTTVTLSMSQVYTLYSGGIVGYAKYAYLYNNTVKGSITRTNINTDIYFGGIVGYATSCLVQENIVTATLNVSVQTTTGTKYLGKIAGFLDIDSEEAIACELLGNYAGENNTTSISVSAITLGLCGGKNADVVINKNYTT